MNDWIANNKTHLVAAACAIVAAIGWAFDLWDGKTAAAIATFGAGASSRHLAG
jgi:hypothetical protein